MTSNIDATEPPPRVNPYRLGQAAATPQWPVPQYLRLGRGHRMGYRVVGAAQGEPWVLVHGGPGSGCQPGMLAPLDLSRQRAIAPDQRGSGSSRPRGKTTASTTAALVADLEALRRHLGLQRWSMLAGSWGTVVALAYAHAHPDRVERLVLRGAFALGRREVEAVLASPHRAGRSGLCEPAWPGRQGIPLPVVLARLRQLLQSGTPGVASLRAVRRWGALESARAVLGLRHSLRHAMALAQPGLAQAIRQETAAMQRRLRQALARVHQPGTRPAERQAWAKFRVQAHYLQHRGFMRPGALDAAVLTLAKQGVPVCWVHGQHDAICPPARSQAWAAMGRRLAPQQVVLVQPLGGHLGHEPAMAAALRSAVRGPL